MASCSRKELIALFAVIAIATIIGVTDGKPPSRISFGRDARRGFFPYMASIRVGRTKAHTCGGAIIGSRFILTAGHCVHGKNVDDFVVRAGFVQTNDPNAIEVKISKIIKHPELQLGSPATLKTKNDIAILVLAEPLLLGRRMQSILLPWHPIWLPEKGIVAGWGLINEEPKKHTTQLKYADVRVLDDSECIRPPSYNPTLYKEKWPIGRQFFCGIQQKGTVQSGDSGSPLIIEDYGYVTVIGIASISVGRDETDNSEGPPPPDTYVNVLHYVPWINQVMSDN